MGTSDLCAQKKQVLCWARSLSNQWRPSISQYRSTPQYRSYCRHTLPSSIRVRNSTPTIFPMAQICKEAISTTGQRSFPIKVQQEREESPSHPLAPTPPRTWLWRLEKQTDYDTLPISGNSRGEKWATSRPLGPLTSLPQPSPHYKDLVKELVG